MAGRNWTGDLATALPLSSPSSADRAHPTDQSAHRTLLDLLWCLFLRDNDLSCVGCGSLDQTILSAVLYVLFHGLGGRVLHSFIHIYIYT